ncbi:MAG: hypothetical protein K2I96_09975, partial [Lachnospiraceae bacterium]|nr:hypothetical protein [Lachnospiraceae bacterium]
MKVIKKYLRFFQNVSEYHVTFCDNCWAREEMEVFMGAEKQKGKRRKDAGLIAGIKYDIKHNPYLCLLCVPTIIWFVIFAYAPLVYLLVAFKKYSATAGLWGSEWVGLKNLEAFFGS